MQWIIMVTVPTTLYMVVYSLLSSFLHAIPLEPPCWDGKTVDFHFMSERIT